MGNSRKLEDAKLNWELQAACRTERTGMFYSGNKTVQSHAKEVCQRCAVSEDCLEYAMANDERFGIWGGLTERERNKLRKARMRRT